MAPLDKQPLGEKVLTPGNEQRDEIERVPIHSAVNSITLYREISNRIDSKMTSGLLCRKLMQALGITIFYFLDSVTSVIPSDARTAA